jgi:tetratricopeptide (TPR) repeat protein
VSTARRPSPEAIEEVLEEAEFFASQGLYSDAEAILSDMLKNAPDHVLLQEQLNEVQSYIQRKARDDSPPETQDPDDNAFDIAASLDALDDLDEPAGSPEMAAPDQEVDVDQVFAKFKEGVKAVVKDSDAATHYDLGLAYKEMALLEDACSEFEIASNDPARTAMCFAMVGLIRREQGRLSDAKAAFLRGLQAKEKSPGHEKGIAYDLALIFQEEGNQVEYLRYLKSLAKRDKNYRDVRARIRALGEAMPEGAPEEDDEFDAAFDNLF